jgi:predicted class III extradiol MEMO1 family dioxygenase
MEAFSQSKSSDRSPVAAGRFYSANKEALTGDIMQLFESCVKTTPQPEVMAIISPMPAVYRERSLHLHSHR